MMDYPVQAPTRLCAATGKAFRPGEKYHGVLAVENGKFIRRDFGLDGWNGPPPGTFSHWTGRVPANGDAARRPPVDDEMLVECFQRLDGAEEPAKVHFRYVVALLLMRRKRFKFEDTSGNTLALRDSRTGDRFSVIDPGLSEEQMATVQDEVFQVLGWNEK